MRINKTKKNLQMIWQLLDDAAGSLDQAFHLLSSMSNITDIEDEAEKIDISAIVSLKNEVEELMNKE